MSKCIVYGCPNHDNKGRFVGNLCVPCHDFLSAEPSGEKDYSFASLNAISYSHKVRKLKEERVNNAIQAIQEEIDLTNCPAWHKAVEVIRNTLTYQCGE